MSVRIEKQLVYSAVNARVSSAEMLGKNVEIITPENGGTMNISPLIKKLDDYHGNPNVHAVLNYGNFFEQLRGVASDEEVDMIKQDQNVHVLQYTGQRHPILVMNEINSLVSSDEMSSSDYLSMVRMAYELIHNYIVDPKSRPEHLRDLDLMSDVDPESYHISLLRAGFIASRASLQVDLTEPVERELIVVSKRFTLNNSDDGALAVSLTFPDLDGIRNIHDKTLVIADIVNPASGISTIALLKYLHEMNIIPKKVILKSVTASVRGILMFREVTKDMGIESVIYTVGAARSMNEKYYLDGGRKVGDAGDILNEFLPDDYKH